MCYELTLEPVGSIDEDVAVCHIDEFDPETVQRINTLTESKLRTVTVEGPVADQVLRCDYVKFTEYYRLKVTTPSSATD